MNVIFNNVDKLLTFELTEEIDHHTTEKIRRRADYEIQRYMPRKVIFDFDSISFMDSAGIGMIIGTYKLIRMLGGTLEIKNTRNNIAKILEMSGVTKILSITPKELNKQAN